MRRSALLAVLLAASVQAQTVPDWAAPGSAPEAPPPALMSPPTPPGGGGSVSQVPVDGGLGLLALAGAAYAARRLRRSE